MSEIEVVERQSVIIRLQSDIINDLFAALSQHVTAEELDSMPCIKKINLAAKMAEEH